MVAAEKAGGVEREATNWSAEANVGATARRSYFARLGS